MYFIKQKNQKNGKFIPEKVGLKAIQRDGVDYECTIVFDIDIKHFAVSSKDRTGLFMDKPDFMISEATGEKILEWCTSPMDIETLKTKIGICPSTKALVTLFKENPYFQEALKEEFQVRKEQLIQTTYERCKEQLLLPKEEMINPLIDLYDEFTYEEISQKIAEIVTPPNIQPEVQVIYQTLEGFHESCPNHKGDWYFTGNYPTPGGNQIINRAFIYYVEGIDKRAY